MHSVRAAVIRRNLPIGSKIAAGFAAVLLDPRGELGSRLARVRPGGRRCRRLRRTGGHVGDLPGYRSGGDAVSAAMCANMSPPTTRIPPRRRSRRRPRCASSSPTGWRASPTRNGVGLLEDIAKQAEAYTADFAHVHEMNLEQTKLETERARRGRRADDRRVHRVLAGAAKAGNTDLLALAAEGRRLSLLARLDVNKRLGGHDEAAAKSAEQQFDG